MKTSVGIMQPYIFPYLGYFQLINAVDIFVFYDDVNYIKRGWINRNKILLDGNEKLISFPCIKASQNKLINQVEIDLTDKSYQKLISTIGQAYKKAPNYEDVFLLVQNVLQSNSQNIGQLAIKSIEAVTSYLDLKQKYLCSSESFGETKGQDKADRLISIVKQCQGNHYINAIGGNSLYNKRYFMEQDIKLSFLQPEFSTYDQQLKHFLPGLSIIDVLMFNDKERVKKMLTEYKLN